MHRRALLSSVAVLSAGCLGSITSNSEPSGHLRDVRLQSVHDDEVPDRLAFDVSVDRSEITVDRTAEVTVSLTNDSDAPLVVRHGSDSPFTPTGSENAKWRLASSGKDITKRSKRCWEPEDVHAFATELAHTYREYEPGQSRTITLELWSYPVEGDERECMPPGTFRFVDDNQLAEMDRSPITDFEWGFELAVET